MKDNYFFLEKYLNRYLCESKQDINYLLFDESIDLILKKKIKSLFDKHSVHFIEYDKFINKELLDKKITNMPITIFLVSFYSPSFYYNFITEVKIDYQCNIVCLFEFNNLLEIFNNTFREFPYHRDKKTVFLNYLGETNYGSKEFFTDNLIKDKTVLELGPLDGSMTGSILAKKPKKLTAVEFQWQNIIKVTVAKHVFKYNNLKIIIDDMHNITKTTYGKYDTLFAHGVLYHSKNPITLAEQLSKISNNIIVGVHTKPHKVLKNIRNKKIIWKQKTYNAIITEDAPLARGGAGLQQTFLSYNDYRDIFNRLNFTVQDIALRENDNNELFYAFIATRT